MVLHKYFLAYAKVQGNVTKVAMLNIRTESNPRGQGSTSSNGPANGFFLTVFKINGFDAYTVHHSS